jgi:acyl carrier protein
MEQQIKKIMSEVFFIDESSIADNASPESIEQWDSINHLNFIVVIEETFSIVFTDEQMMEMLNLPLVVEITKQAIKSKG